MKALLKNNRYFFSPLLIFFLLGIGLIMFSEKSALHLFFNSYHNFFLNYFFYYTTFLGDGFTAVILTFILLMVKYRYSLFVGLSCILSSGITHFIKQFVFPNAERPVKFFEGIADLHLLEQVQNYSYNSFPSGHTTIAFAMCTSLVFFVPQKKYQLVLFFTALLIGFSRVYISQHFFEDVYTGALIGSIMGCVVYLIFRNYKTGGALDSNLLKSLRS